MIKPTDVRIGNLVYEMGQAVRVDLGVLKCLSEHKPGDEIFHGGIELNSIVLNQLGFIRETKSSWSYGFEKKYDVYKKGPITYNSIQAQWWLNSKILDHQPEYVHELQNLYFAVTGQELVIGTSF